MKLTGLVFVFLILFSNCKPTATSTSDSTVNLQEASPEEVDYIVNASFSIKKVNANYAIDVLAIQKKKGRLKTPHKTINAYSKKHLVCSVLDKNNTVLESITLPDPLVRDVEYIDATNQFVKRTIALDSANFTARFSVTKASKFISISYVLENATRLPLKKIKL